MEELLLTDIEKTALLWAIENGLDFLEDSHRYVYPLNSVKYRLNWDARIKAEDGVSTR